MHRTLGNYRLDAPLGRGGMGAVFLAYDTSLHRQVALKLMDETGDAESTAATLLREARNAAALNHPHICTIHEVGRDAGITFIAMEYVAGSSLRERIDGSGALSHDEALRIGIQVADALAYAHEHGVVHRDFKAANVMITSEGRAKIVDFGLARRNDALIAQASTIGSVVAAGALAGTPYAMAPEQVRGEAADERTDVWALGVLLYEVLTGNQPFTGTSVAELFAAILKEPLALWPRAVPIATRTIVERCLHKEPSRRFQQAREVQRALEDVQLGRTPVLETWRYRLTRTRWMVAAVVLAVLTSIAALLWRQSVNRSAPIRLAVLPYENLTGDPSQAYLSDGLTEETISALGRLHPERLTVIARTSSMRYRGRDAAIEQMGRDLRVQYVLAGSARREGSRVRVTTALIDVSDGTERWTDTFERELSSILVLQSDVARGVANSLALTLLPNEQSRLDRTSAVNAEAYEAYLKGLSFQANPSPANLNAALQYFEFALQKDADYAPAYTGVAGVWFARLVTSLATKRDAAAVAKSAIDRALALDDSSPEAHFRMAQYHTLISWDWAAADREFRRALELNPNQAATRSVYADYLAIVGRSEDALQQAERAMALDPVSTQSQTFYARILMFTRRHEEAIARYRETLSAAPDQQVAIANIRLVLHSAGRYDEALAADRVWAAANTTRGGQDVSDALSRGYAEGGYRLAMRRAAEAEAARAHSNPALGFLAAQFYVRAGENALALDWLEKAFAIDDAAAPYLSCAPIWDDVRGEPRFRALLARMHLPN